IYKSAENGYNLIQNLLNWELTKNGLLKQNSTEINLETFLSEQVLIHNTTASIKNINITTKLQNKLIVFVNENTLTTVIRNLISNAIKFTNNNGTIFLDAYKEDNNIAITVTDNGIGIDKDKIKQINNNSIATKKEVNRFDTGFGLIICKEFIKKWNGKLIIESSPKIGSKFIVTIPLQKVN
ncbi:MAG: HAMP domain-containing sensor histidine kinase, partial [Bacteroidota bacterium]|nr:HAMP domain-containing sensor histidine kinase [Bacteroidota bacterium]